MNNKILLVEDTIDAYELVQRSLGSQFELYWAQTLASAKELLASTTFDLILLDVMLPDGDGFDLASYIQSDENISKIPIMFLTAKNSVNDKIHGFSIGADDYIPKPFEPLELKARVESRLRRIEKDQISSEIMRIGNIELNKSTQSIRFRNSNDSERIELTPIEFKLLIMFAKSPGKIFNRDDVLGAVWGEKVHVYTRSVDTHVSKLRKKLGPFADYIQSVHGSGYRLLVEAIPQKRSISNPVFSFV